MSKLDELNQQVTSAIFKQQEASREVSRLEEDIAKLTELGSSEGEIARRGAVRAAMVAGDTERARQLAFRYVAECGEEEFDIDFAQKLLAMVAN